MLNTETSAAGSDTATLMAQYDSLKTGSDYSSQIEIVNNILTDTTLSEKDQQKYAKILTELKTKKEDATIEEKTTQNVVSFADGF